MKRTEFMVIFLVFSLSLLFLPVLNNSSSASDSTVSDNYPFSVIGRTNKSTINAAFESKTGKDSINHITALFDDTKQPSDIRRAMVKIYASNGNLDRANSWEAVSEEKSNGSGCIIGENMILTNAHVIDDRSVIEVRKFGSSRKYKAHILYVSHESDLALLGVKDGEFYSDVTPLEFGELPDNPSDVSIYGFPGGESLVITSGLFSEVEQQNYLYSNESLPAGNILVSVKPGNSGGAVISNGRLVGVVMQTARKSRKTLMVPVKLINDFLMDIDDGHFDGYLHSHSI